MIQLSEGMIRDLIETAIGQHSGGVKKINDTIWSSPELAWHETTAHDAICDYFDSLGSDYRVTRQAYGINTSFQVEARNDPPPSGSRKSPRTIVFNAEYDALPGMALVENTDPPQYQPAHACGHNLIASSSIAAFVACWETLKATGGTGIVRLLGTPAEERGGGKIRLLEAGAYIGVDACMMVHPGPMTSDKSLTALSFTRSLASQRIPVAFEGLASHAGFAPWKGRNALDALVASYVSISALRQQLKPTLRVSGIITCGGKAANIIPDHTAAEFSIRAESRKELDGLREKVTHCFESGAKGANCTVTVNSTRRAYWDMLSNSVLCECFTKCMNDFGIKTVYRLPEITDNPGAASDQGKMGTSSLAIQPTFFIQSGDAANHTPAFATAAHTDDAFVRAMACSKGLAAVGYKVLTDDKVANAVASEFELAISEKVATLLHDYGVKPPTQQDISCLSASLPPPLQRFLETPSVARERVFRALMATDMFVDRLRGSTEKSSQLGAKDGGA
ncbi:MAG: hypothetical protein M1840_005876 [Geoglossum simile]|nr:MAG: hypothetical protein M1840_005876 [Geoglossum simile]